MDIITLRYKKETGLTAYRFNFFSKRIGYTTDYTKWLEKQCTMRIVSQQSEMLNWLNENKYFDYYYSDKLDVVLKEFSESKI